MTVPALDAAEYARRFHEAYERLAPQFGYETRRESAVPWDEVPAENRRLMIAVCAVVLADLDALVQAVGRMLTDDDLPYPPDGDTCFCSMCCAIRDTRSALSRVTGEAR